jgi:hypothetical protein
VAGCCEYDDEPTGSGATDLVTISYVVLYLSHLVHEQNVYYIFTKEKQTQMEQISNSKKHITLTQ